MLSALCCGCRLSGALAMPDVLLLLLHRCLLWVWEQPAGHADAHATAHIIRLARA